MIENYLLLILRAEISGCGGMGGSSVPSPPYTAACTPWKIKSDLFLYNSKDLHALFTAHRHDV